jgi:hypothetical protein
METDQGGCAMNIKNAAFKRIMEWNEQVCADVEVELEGETSHLVVLFAETTGGEFDMVSVLRKNGQHETDWYDPNVHSAYVDVTESFLSEPFKEQVLSFGNVLESIRDHLAEYSDANMSK